MLVINTKQINSTFERIVRDKNGVLVCVRFIVVEVNGVFKPEIVSIQPLVVENAVFLPIFNENKVIVEDTTPSFISKISPYFFLDFFMSQLTRAPSF